MEKKISLVTGANGHLGNNLVRQLLRRGENVRAGVRNISDKKPFEGLECEVVYTDLLDKESLRSALKGVDVLYQVAAVFKHWSENPEKDIIEPNVVGTKNILEIAKEMNVRKVVYISSVAALSADEVNLKGKIDETSWQANSFGNAYFESKLKSEKLAWEIAKNLNLDMVTILPGAMVGGEFIKKTSSTIFFDNIINEEMKISFESEMSIVDVMDVVKGIISAAERGIKGTRYIMTNEIPLKIDDMYRIAKTLKPQLQQPPKLSKEQLLGLAEEMELEAKKNGTVPPLQKSQVYLYCDGINRMYDLTTSMRDLGFKCKDGEKALKEHYCKIYSV
ncbi:MAG: NAD-dependent epimerase/dehydratase family protein [Clostridiaceae bacterium]